MIRKNPEMMTVDQLVDEFAAIGIEQDQANLYSDVSKYKRLFRRMRAIEEELKRRSGDQRGALLKLYQHPNAQVRFHAAGATLAVAPDAARRALEAIANSRKYPEAGEAGMTLFNLDSGIFKPK